MSKSKEKYQSIDEALREAKKDWSAGDNDPREIAEAIQTYKQRYPIPLASHLNKRGHTGKESAPDIFDVLWNIIGNKQVKELLQQGEKIYGLYVEKDEDLYNDLLYNCLIEETKVRVYYDPKKAGDNPEDFLLEAAAFVSYINYAVIVKHPPDLSEILKKTKVKRYKKRLLKEVKEYNNRHKLPENDITILSEVIRCCSHAFIHKKGVGYYLGNLDNIKEKYYKNLRDLVEENVRLHKEVEALKKKTRLPIRMSRDLIDTTLSVQKAQLDLLNPEIRDKILSSHGESTLYQGLPLSGKEWKIIYIFYKFLNERNGYEENPETAFVGDKAFSKSNGGLSPGLILTNYQIAKEYYGKNPSGKSIENIKNILDTFKDRKFCFTYTAESKKKEYTIQEYGALFSYGTITQTDKATRKGESTEYIRLHPLFRSQILDKFVVWPDNILNLLEEAHGQKQMGAEVFNLFAHITRSQSSKRYSIEIAKDKLIEMISPENISKSRKKDAYENTLSAIETLKRLGVIESIEERPAKSGKLTYYIKTLNPWRGDKKKSLE